jgi:hypothetical protein
MKPLRKIFALLIVLFIYSCAVQRPISAQQGYVSMQVFYDQLSPYGQWADNPNYGYVWFPNAGRDFSPYSTNGYWVMTEYGWTWVSNYAWGWAPFHYGRWDYDNYYGWFWVPDNEWGPSWVTWRRANGYYGWSPMRPGISVNLSFGGGYNDIDRWNFVPERDFGRRDIDRYYSNRSNNDMIIRNSTIINNTYIDNSRNVTYIAGPHRDDVQRVTGRSIGNVTIRDNDRPGEKLNNNRLNIYRPRVERINNEGQKPTPSRTINMKDIRPAEERNAAYPQKNVKPVQNNRRVEQKTQQQHQEIQSQQRQIKEQNQGQQQQQIKAENQRQQQQQMKVENQRQQQQQMKEKQQGQQQIKEQKQGQQNKQKQGKTTVEKQDQLNKQQDKKVGNQSENKTKSKRQTTTPPSEKKNRKR